MKLLPGKYKNLAVALGLLAYLVVSGCSLKDQPRPLTNPALTKAGAPAPMPSDASAFLQTQPQPITQPKQSSTIMDLIDQATHTETNLSARAAIVSQFQKKVIETLKHNYDNWQNPYKMDWDSFLRDAEQKSNNFDPKNPYTAKMIAGDDYKNYLKNYAMLSFLRSIDINSAANHRLGPFSGHTIKELLHDKDTLEADYNFDRLASYLATEMTEGKPEYVPEPGLFGIAIMVSPYEEYKRSVSERIETIIRASQSNEDATKGIYDLLTSYGYDFQILKEYGLMN